MSQQNPVGVEWGSWAKAGILWNTCNFLSFISEISNCQAVYLCHKIVLCTYIMWTAEFEENYGVVICHKQRYCQVSRNYGVVICNKQNTAKFRGYLMYCKISICHKPSSAPSLFRCIYNPRHQNTKCTSKDCMLIFSRTWIQNTHKMMVSDQNLMIYHTRRLESGSSGHSCGCM